MNDTDRIDKEAGLIKLVVGQECSAGVVHNIYSGDRKCYAAPFVHKIWTGGVIGGYAVPYQEKEVGLIIRITNDGTIVGNPNYTGNAVVAFLDKKFANCDIHSVKIVKVNRRSVNVEPIEYKELKSK